MKTDAEMLGFEYAGIATEAPQITEPLDPQSPERRMAEQASEVALFYKGREVHVRNISVDQNGFLMGEVFSVAHLCAMHYESLKLGQRITFRYLHVHHLLT